MARKKPAQPTTSNEDPRVAERIEQCRRGGGTYLDLSGLGLTSVPESLGDLTQLQTLYLHNNKLSSVPESLGGLAQLRELILHSNQLSSVPEFLGDLTQLQNLSFSGNQLSSVPESLGNLTQLQTLSFSDNQLSSVPESLGNLTQLQTLFLQDNQLSSVPESLGNVAQLRDLYLDDNPLNPELAAAYAQGIDAFKAYLRSTAEAEIVLNEGKLILVGEGEVGKSCLLAALRKEEWQERDSTHGIEVKPVSVSAPNGTTITLNGWDFGGQKVYRPTHQLFFSSPAVYLVVWKPREGAQAGLVEEWIKLILLREPTAKILVVATHGGPNDRKPDIPSAEIRARFGADHVLGFFHVDSKPDKKKQCAGLKALLDKIGEVAAGMPEVSRKVPTKWQSAREAFKKKGETAAYLPYQEFARSCRDDHKMTDEQTTLFCRISHELGDLIHYHTDPALKDVVVLKPNWLAKAISFVLDDKITRERHGLADHDHLCQLWSNPPAGETGYPAALHPVFLKLMEKFDLSYPVALGPPGTPSRTTLIAQLVDDARPAALPGWDEPPAAGEFQKQQICRIVDEKGQAATTEGLFYQLIVRLHMYSLGRNDYVKSVHWQRGLLLDDDYNGRAFLEHLDDNVQITVRAPYPEQFLGNLTGHVRSLVESFWKGVRCEVMVPCIVPCGLNQPGQGLFEVRKLIAGTRNNRPEFPCNVSGCDQWHNTHALLRNAPAPVAEARRELLGGFDQIKAQLADIFKTIRTNAVADQERFTILNDGQKALLSRIDEQFDGLMRSLLDEAKDGPRLFSFEAVKPGFWDRPKWVSEKFRLTLWCEHSQKPLPDVAGDKKAGVYELTLPREWVKRAAPYLRFLSKTLSLVLPVASSAAKLALPDARFKAIVKELDFGIKCADSVLKGGVSAGEWLAEADAPDLDPTTGSTRANGGALRELHAFLKKEDPSFGGLLRVQNKRREFLWIDPQFADKY